ncbi:MAG: S8 family serine peptidase [Bacteroidales bacterium]|jgi:hypothetical protein|nr:S8 family serine peptidase [Bacteroidales bacterium]
MKKFLNFSLFILLFSIFFDLSAQKYAVYFADKSNSPYNIDNPEEFLSQRSIDRRNRHQVTINEQDLPVNPQYVQQLKNLGAEVPFTSRWLNCALISCSETAINQIEQLSFVSEIIYVSPESYGGKSLEGDLQFNFSNKFDMEEVLKPIDSKSINEEYSYGAGYNQINQINGIPVHENGFTGDGVLIAVLDGGFRNVNSLNVFSNIITENRLVFDLDVVIPNGNIYSSSISAHGTNVLSCMSASSDNQFVGTAPKASYALIRTEDTNTEYLIECYNWVVGAEAADSIGADIINSSLSYSTFNDSSMDYTYSSMDGETAVASYAAKLAVEKGIFVTLSAGNSNGTTWPWVASPADAVYAATIGAVNSSGEITYFSSIGPNGAGVPKPNTLAEGNNATVYNANNGNISSASGTSFSSPITCGMYACLIQANPYIHPTVLRDIVDETGNRYPNHDIAYGYGIPDFAAALETVISMNVIEITNVEINDLQGNNDGKLNAGETVTLNITAKNKTSEALTNVNATLSTDNEDINIIDNLVEFGNFLPNETKTITNAFTFTLSENAIANTSIKFCITASFDDNDIYCVFFVNTYGHHLQYQSFEILDYSGNSNNMFDPGETADILVDIINNGNEAANNIVAVLSSNSTYVTINSNTFNMDDVLVSQVKQAEFNVSISNSAPSGAISIPFTLTLTDSDGKISYCNFVYSDKCNIIFELTDEYGDGWNGAAIIMFFDNDYVEYITFDDGYFAEIPVEAPVNTNIALSWHAGLWHDDECSFVVKYEDGPIIYESDVAPSAGEFYTFLNYCGIELPDPPLHAPQYAVHFKDKNNSPYTINEPLKYLSQRAIDRRNKFGIALTENDFPVNPNYISEVETTGAYVRSSSRWSNSVLVYAEDEMIEAIGNLDFVEKIVYVKPAEGKCIKHDIHPKWENVKTIESILNIDENYNYGSAFAQINQLNGITVHEQGFTAEGVLIAVLDSGFEHVDVIDGFTHLFDSEKILLAIDVVEPGRNVYETGIHNHGTSVLSCMGGYIDGSYVGTAPNASYALIRTEDAPTEYLIEEYFWMIGAEMADSLGVDIINSSLSYNTYDDPSMDHQYSEMDGKTAVSSIAAKMAVERGIFVTISAGNSNGTSWPWVGTPSDVPEVLTLGAVNASGQIASFSSIGPNGAGDLKPNVVACGSYASVISSGGNIGYASGTSFSSPITCGMVACIIGAASNIAPPEILAAVEQSANRYPNHDIAYGYGIPDFGNVLEILDFQSIDDYNNSSKLIIYPNPVDDRIYVENKSITIKSIELYDLAGKLIKNVNVNSSYASVDVRGLNKGIFFVKVMYDNSYTETIKIVKQ